MLYLKFMLLKWSKCFQIKNSNLYWRASILLSWSTSSLSLLSAQSADLALGLLVKFGQWGAAGDWRKRGGCGWHFCPWLLPCISSVRQPPPHGSVSVPSDRSLLLPFQVPRCCGCPTAPGHDTIPIFMNRLPNMTCHLSPAMTSHISTNNKRLCCCSKRLKIFFSFLKSYHHVCNLLWSTFKKKKDWWIEMW